MNKVIALLIIAICIFALSACDTATNNTPVNNNEAEQTTTNQTEISNGETTTTGNGIVVNEIENLASAKLLAETKFVEKEELPEDIKYLADLGEALGLKLDFASEVYTKSDMSSEEFDTLHDYSFLYTRDDKSAKITLSKEETPLRDYFFNTTQESSKIDGTNVVVSKFEDKYIVRFNYKDINFDVETNGMSQEEMVSFVKEILK